MSARKELLYQLFEDMDATKRLMHPCFVHVLGEIGISPAQAHVLFVIEDGQPLSLKRLAAKMWLTPGAITQLVDGIARLGYVTRTQDERDRRVVYISLSSAGTALMSKITNSRSEFMAQIMATLDDTELRQLAGLQRKIVQNLEAHSKAFTAKKEKV